MERITIHYSWISPRKTDFAKYNSKIVINNSLICYALDNSNTIRLILPHDIETITNDDNFKANYKNMMCKLINDLPEDSWQQVIKELNLKQYDRY
ncbi:MAG: hypothetical protein ACK5WP_09365 [Neisseriaceae bacterium]|jgi:hypothetical protein